MSTTEELLLLLRQELEADLNQAATRDLHIRTSMRIARVNEVLQSLTISE